jgi:nucleoside-diphosphate-sugar epimerase
MMDKNNKKIDILGNCSNLRNFLYAKDMGKIIDHFVKKELTGIYNVASDESISIYNLVYEIKKITQYEGELIFNFTDLIDSRYISNHKLRTILGHEWKFTSLSEGLENTYQWMLKNA